jgi:hypothetical protein
MRARNAYESKDREAMKAVAAGCDKALELLDVFHKKFKNLWMKENKSFGFEVQELRLGGLMLRLRSAKEAFEAYANGEIDTIEEFDVELLDHLRGGTRGKMPRLNSWGRVASPSVI